MATGNTNDKQRENASKPSSGYSTARHAGKADKANPNAGVVDENRQKADGKNRVEPISKPSHGGTYHKEKKNGKNRVEPLSNPQGV